MSFSSIATESDFLIYTREADGQRVLVALNLTDAGGAISFLGGQVKGAVMVSVYGDRDGEAVKDTVSLRGNEGLVIALD